MQSQLNEGIAHEAAEHKDVTHGDKEIAKKIAMAHLKEDPQYYTHLNEMEEQVKKMLKKGKENGESGSTDDETEG